MKPKATSNFVNFKQKTTDMKKTIFNDTLDKSKKISSKNKTNVTDIHKLVSKKESTYTNLKYSVSTKLNSVAKAKKINELTQIPTSIAKLTAEISKKLDQSALPEYKKKHISPPHKSTDKKQEASKSRLTKSSVMDLKKKISPGKSSVPKLAKEEQSTLSIKPFSGLKSKAVHNSSIKKINSSLLNNQSKTSKSILDKPSMNSTNSKNLANLLEKTIPDLTNLPDIPSEFIDKFRDFLSESEKEEISKLKRIYFVGKLRTRISSTVKRVDGCIARKR